MWLPCGCFVWSTLCSWPILFCPCSNLRMTDLVTPYMHCCSRCSMLHMATVTVRLASCLKPVNWPIAFTRAGSITHLPTPLRDRLSWVLSHLCIHIVFLGLWPQFFPHTLPQLTAIVDLYANLLRFHIIFRSKITPWYLASVTNAITMLFITSGVSFVT